MGTITRPGNDKSKQISSSLMEKAGRLLGNSYNDNCYQDADFEIFETVCYDSAIPAVLVTLRQANLYL